jgi:hypothetical protein
MKSNLRAMLLAICVAHCSTPANGQSDKQEYWEPIEPYRIVVDTSDPEVRTLLSRWERIDGGLSTVANSFAGTYERSGYRGYFLRWSPENGFIYVYHSEGLSIIDFSYGKVTVTSEGIIFDPERDMRETFRGYKLKLPPKWVPIKIEDRVFFVAAEEIKSFGDYVGGFGQYNDFNGPCCEFSPFFTRQELKPQKSFPGVDVPKSYRKFIKAPVTAQITFVGKKRLVKNYGLQGQLYGHWFEKASLTSITVNAGRASGIRRNMLLRLIDEQGPQYLKIIRVGKNASQGVLIRDVDNDGKETFFDYNSESKVPQEKSFLPIRIGTRVTTSPISNF